MIDECQVTDALAARGIVPDTQQRNAIGALVVLLGARTRRSWPWQVRAMDGVRGVRGVYCHGLPGRGKSLVVDTVFELATCPKRRIHFHEFLREMNQRLVRHARARELRLHPAGEIDDVPRRRLALGELDQRRRAERHPQRGERLFAEPPAQGHWPALRQGAPRSRSGRSGSRRRRRYGEGPPGGPSSD